MTVGDYAESYVINISVAKITRCQGNKRKWEKSLPFKSCHIVSTYTPITQLEEIQNNITYWLFLSYLIYMLK